MQDEEPRDEGLTRELAAEQEEADVGADHRDTQHDGLGDPQTVAGQQVVDHRVAEEALDQRQHRQQHADDPVHLPRLTERAGEEDAEHVHDHRDDEDQRRPVVDLPHEQTATDLERDVQRGVERLGDVLPGERGVGTVVGGLGRARDEPEGQEGAAQQQDDEAVERDLTEHERPVVGEDLAGETPDDLGGPDAFVEPVPGRGTGLLERTGGAHERSQ